MPVRLESSGGAAKEREINHFSILDYFNSLWVAAAHTQLG